MKDVFLIYNSCCFYEIVILNYFMQFTGCDVLICSPDGKSIRSMEGYSVNADMSLAEVDRTQIRSFIVPGGNISSVDTQEVITCLRELRENHVLIAGICAGVDLLDHAGILQGVRSTHSTDSDVMNDNRVITARANAYVDFAIEVAKELELFVSDEDLQETIAFWKYHQRME